MKKNLSIVLMCVGGCMLDSNGMGFIVALGMTLIPAIVLIVGELVKKELVAEIDENVLVDYATRNDMVQEGGLI